MLNDEMDQQCKHYWEASQGSTPIWFDNKWSVRINGEKIVSDLTTTIRKHCSIIRAEQYWRRKITDHTEHVDWEGTGAAIRGIKKHRRQWLTKHISGFCSVGRMAKRVGLRDTDTCPRCNQEETAEHVWICQHQDVNLMWEKSMEELQRVLGQSLTPVSITTAIVDGLNSWRNGNEVRFNVRLTAGQLGLLQAELGWKHFFEGRLHHQWRQEMTKHYSNIGERKTGKRWISSLIKKLWEIAWDLWEHRNGVMHDKINGYANQSLTEKIKELWRHLLLKATPSIKHMLKEGEESILGKSLQQKQQWVVRVEVAIQRYAAM
jgi:hypothetical protein